MVKKRKVLFFIYQMGGGGAARTILNIVNNIDRKRFTPILVTLNYNGTYEENINENVKFIKLNTKRLRKAIFPLASLIKKEKIDIVFSTIPNYNTIAILSTLFSRTNAKIVVREAAYLGGTLTSNFKLRLYGLLYRFSKKVIALSEGVKENIVQRYKVHPEKIRVIYNPVDVSYINKSINHGEIKKKHRSIFEGDDKVIVTAGRLVSDKDHDTMLKAFAMVQFEIESRLVILGEGELEEKLKDKARELNIGDKVYFIGFQYNPYIYFYHADVFALSSLREGFGHVLVEALASETPVVSTNCKPGASEVLANGKYGVLCEVGNEFDLAEKIIEVLKLNKKERDIITARGLERAQDFDAKTIVKQYEEVFDEVMDIGEDS